MISWHQKARLVFLLALEKLFIRKRTREEVRLYNIWRANVHIKRSKKAMNFAKSTRDLRAQRDARQALIRANSKLKYADRPPVEKDPNKFIDGLRPPARDKITKNINITPKDD